MKRGAERQIQREDGDDPYGLEGADEDEGSRSAGPSASAARPIRGLPKKKLAGGSLVPASISFGGFSSPATVSFSPPSTFSFGSTTSDGASAPLNGSTSSPAASPFSFSQPATANGPQNAAPAPTPPPPSFSSSSSSSSSSPPSDVEYYRSLRGINESLRQQLASTLEGEVKKDPFADISSVLKDALAKYEEYRRAAQTARSAKKASAPVSSISPQPPSALSFKPSQSTAVASSATLAKSANDALLAGSSSGATEVKALANGLSLPEVPSGGFSFAGSGFAAPSTSKAAPAPLLPGQPTFTAPSSGFYASFGKDGPSRDEGDDESDDEDNDEDDNDDNDDNDDGEQQGTVSAIARSGKPTEAPLQSAPLSFSAPTVSAPTSTLKSNSASGGQLRYGFGGATATRPADVGTSTSTPTFAFGQTSGAGTSSPFGSISKSSLDTSSSSNENATSSPKPTFSFGQSSSTAPSLFGATSKPAASSAAVPAIGANFANTSGVQQPGAFAFGSSKINFGAASSSTDRGSTASGENQVKAPASGSGSAGFSFGARLGSDAKGRDEGGDQSK